MRNSTRCPIWIRKLWGKFTVGNPRIWLQTLWPGLNRWWRKSRWNNKNWRWKDRRSAIKKLRGVLLSPKYCLNMTMKQALLISPKHTYACMKNNLISKSKKYRKRVSRFRKRGIYSNALSGRIRANQNLVINISWFHNTKSQLVGCTWRSKSASSRKICGTGKCPNLIFIGLDRPKIATQDCRRGQSLLIWVKIRRFGTDRSRAVRWF